MNFIKRFQDAQVLSVSLGKTYSEYQLMHMFRDNFHQGGTYSTQIASHQTELKRGEKFTDQKSLSISSLQTDYLNIGRSSGCGKNSERSNLVQTKCNFCGGANHSADFFKRIRKKKEKACAAGDSDNRRTEGTPRKCFRCGSTEHLISKCPKPPKDNDKHKKQVSFSERGNCALQKECNNG